VTGPSIGKADALPRLLTRALLVYFALQLCFFALRIHPDVPPDEFAHLGIARLYSSHLLLPADAPETIEYGAIAGQPYLYYWLAGKLLWLDVFGLSERTFLRLVSALMAMGTVVYGLRWSALVGASPWARVLLAVFLTNTLMFTGIGAAVSYDALVNLLSAMAIFHLYRWLRERDPSDLLWLSGLTLAGCLTKTSFLPLAPIFALAVLLGRGTLPSFTRRQLPAVAAVALLALANLVLYGGNYLAYGGLTPELEQLVGRGEAVQNRIVARAEILRAYREGRMDFGQAKLATRSIQHEADRRSTLALLHQTRRVGDHRLGLGPYSMVWGRLMLTRTFGYFGHRSLPIAPRIQLAFASIALIGLLCFAGSRLHGAGDPQPGLGRGLLLAGSIAGAYVAVLIFGVNRPTYLETGLIDLAVQGRYVFPVLVPIAGFVAVSLAQLAPTRLRLPLSAAVALFFLYRDLPYFLLNTTPQWFTKG